jgi:hypothetical protein
MPQALRLKSVLTRGAKKAPFTICVTECLAMLASLRFLPPYFAMLIFLIKGFYDDPPPITV